jgi:hypothetical protein
MEVLVLETYRTADDERHKPVWQQGAIAPKFQK